MSTRSSPRALPHHERLVPPLSARPAEPVMPAAFLDPRRPRPRARARRSAAHGITARRRHRDGVALARRRLLADRRGRGGRHSTARRAPGRPCRVRPR
jgi:hypothetical protein